MSDLKDDSKEALMEALFKMVLFYPTGDKMIKYILSSGTININKDVNKDNDTLMNYCVGRNSKMALMLFNFGFDMKEMDIHQQLKILKSEELWEYSSLKLVDKILEQTDSGLLDLKTKEGLAIAEFALFNESGETYLKHMIERGFDLKVNISVYVYSKLPRSLLACSLSSSYMIPSLIHHLATEDADYVLQELDKVKDRMEEEEIQEVLDIIEPYKEKAQLEGKIQSSSKTVIQLKI